MAEERAAIGLAGAGARNDGDFLSLAHLHFARGVTIGTLATAIEQHGVFAQDAFERWRHCGPDSEQGKLALDRLARQVKRNADVRRDELPDLDPESDALFQIGWPEADVPAVLGGDASARVKVVRPSDVQRRERNLLHLLGAMEEAMLGRCGCPPHPAFASRQQIADFIDCKFKGFDGLGKTRVAERLSEAAKLLAKLSG